MAKADLRCCVLAFHSVRFTMDCDQDETKLYPVKIKAIQGHSDLALKGAGGLFATAAAVMCAPSVPPERQAAFTGVPVIPMSEVPAVAYHRTNRSNWKSMAKSGLIPGGGDAVAMRWRFTCPSSSMGRRDIAQDYVENAPSRSRSQLARQ